ncbi:hypothetical protein V5F41_03345 [Xanthobacter autotrophicus]|uniref:hypothetical protein n=1 Tax=Xanthobacter autotrophicus TaxID=280 RepID=UPI0037262A0E
MVNIGWIFSRCSGDACARTRVAPSRFGKRKSPASSPLAPARGSRHPGVATTDTPGGQQGVTIINESGLYILVLTSRRPVSVVVTGSPGW